MSQGPIVVGTDGSPRAELAVDKAGELALALGAEVHVACAAGAMVGGAGEWPLRMSAQRVVHDASERLRERGLTVQEHLPQDRGDAALALVAVADYVGAQTIVVGNKGVTGVRRLLGSVPGRLSHGAQRSVLIVSTDSPSLTDYSGASILVGTDGSSGSMQAVTEAVRLAKALQGELHIASAAQPGSILEEAAAKAKSDGVSAITHELHGDAADGLRKLAEQNNAVIIVVGSNAGEREWFGNLAQQVSHAGIGGVLLVSTVEGNGTDGDALSAVAAADAGPSGDEVTA